MHMHRVSAVIVYTYIHMYISIHIYIYIMYIYICIYVLSPSVRILCGHAIVLQGFCCLWLEIRSVMTSTRSAQIVSTAVTTAARGNLESPGIH